MVFRSMLWESHESLGSIKDVLARSVVPSARLFILSSFPSTGRFQSGRDSSGFVLAPGLELGLPKGHGEVYPIDAFSVKARYVTATGTGSRAFQQAPTVRNRVRRFFSSKFEP